MDKNVYRTILNYDENKVFIRDQIIHFEIFDLALTPKNLILTPMILKKMDGKTIIRKDIKEIEVSIAMSPLTPSGISPVGLAFNFVITLNDSKIILEFYNLTSLLKAAAKLEEEGYKLNDPLSLLTALDTMRYLELEMYLNTNFKRLAKEHPSIEGYRSANRYVGYNI